MTTSRRMVACEPANAGRAFPLEICASRSLWVRREPLTGFGLPRPLKLLYASDLHLGAWHSRQVADQVATAARQTACDLIVLGGDLADSQRGLPLLRRCVRRLADLCPVWAIGGNHDARVGLHAVRAAVESAGGGWLPGKCVTWPSESAENIRLEGHITPKVGTGNARILCAHDPAVFPRAAAAGYALVLAGHLHGGQWVLARRHDLLYPGAWFYRWNGLRFRSRGAVMLVSRGVADTLPIRWNCPREVLLCELR